MTGEVVQEIGLTFEPDAEPPYWVPGIEQITLTYPDGGVAAWQGTITRVGDVTAKMSIEPNTYVYTPAPWRKRLAYWLKCRWWQLTGKWKRGVENDG